MIKRLRTLDQREGGGSQQKNEEILWGEEEI